jgi:hypothetical protein
MRHLSHVEYIELGFWSQQLDPYPAFWQDSLRQGASRSTQEEQLSQMYQSSKLMSGQILLSCMPCIPGSTLMDDEEEPLGDLSNGAPLHFPSIKTARLRRGSQWFVDHCPNLEHFFDAGCVKKWEALDLVALGRRCPRVQTLDTLLVASPDVILGKYVLPSHIHLLSKEFRIVALSHFPLLEVLVVIAPAAQSGAGRIQVSLFQSLLMDTDPFSRTWHPCWRKQVTFARSSFRGRHSRGSSRRGENSFGIYWMELLRHFRSILLVSAS